MKTETKVYPNLETMCRLCLKENAGTVTIFANEESGDKCTALSIPTRIMICAALEVQRSDAFPKKICTDCRLQLEKSYYFRKLSQESDTKLRRHLRLVGMGKASKVFDAKLEDDDDDLEFHDSLAFIKQQEDLQKKAEKLKIDNFLNEIKLQNEQDLQKVKDNLINTCRQELTPKLREELREELQVEIKHELEERIRKEVTEQCIRQAKESLRSEVKEECRQLEMKSLLEDMQTYLIEKNKSLQTFPSTNTTILKRLLPGMKNESPSKMKCVGQQQPPSKVEVVRMEVQLTRQNSEKDGSAESIKEVDPIENDEECDSDGNFYIYDSEEGFELQKKSLDDKIDYDDNVPNDVEYEEEFMDSNFVTYEKVNEESVDPNEDSGENISTASYRIEDNEDGEIKFLKKSNDGNDKNINTENSSQKDEYKDIMVINISDDIKNEYVEYIREEEQKNEKSKKKRPAVKNKKSAATRSSASLVTRTKSSVPETTILTNSYVNPMQRCTDTPKIFKCDNCPMVFSTKLTLERHLNTHRKVEKTGITYQCPECFIVVSCSGALRRHMYVHCEQKPFTCTVCSKSFVQKEILKRHMQTHTGIKPHVCPHCDRSFAQRINLTQHINRTHSKEPQIQQHACYLCPKRFNHASGLSRHLVSHSGVAFQCSECDRTFGDRSSIKRHIANVHNNVRFSKSIDNTENT